MEIINNGKAYRLPVIFFLENSDPRRWAIIKTVQNSNKFCTVLFFKSLSESSVPKNQNFFFCLRIFSMSLTLRAGTRVSAVSTGA